MAHTMTRLAYCLHLTQKFTYIIIIIIIIIIITTTIFIVLSS